MNPLMNETVLKNPIGSLQETGEVQEIQPASDGEWSQVISPRSSIFDLHLKEVWSYRDLMMMFVRRDFAASYKQTILGPLWHVIQPVFTTIMFLVVFGKLANIPIPKGIPDVLFYMSGITIWNYFSTCLTSTSNTFVANAGIFGKVYFPRLIIPLSVVISNIVRFGIQFGLLLAIMMYMNFFGSFHMTFNAWWLCIPVLVLIMAGLGLGLGIIISSLTTKYRDFAILIGFGVQLLMYATPIAYPLSVAESKSFAWAIHLNPLTGVVEAFKYALFQQGSFGYGDLWYSIAFMAVVLFIGLLMFSKIERSFMDTV
jgi:lipopolysaccharide transport system permease protein